MLLSGVFRVSVCPFPSICNLLSVPNCWGDATPPSIIRRNYRILSLSLLIVTLTSLAIVLISDTSPTIPTCHPLLHHMSSSAEQRHPPSPISSTLVAIWPPLTASRHLCPRCTCFCSTDSSSTGIFFSRPYTFGQRLARPFPLIAISVAIWSHPIAVITTFDTAECVNDHSTGPTISLCERRRGESRGGSGATLDRSYARFDCSIATLDCHM